MRHWLSTYGPTVRFVNTLRRPALVTVDPFLVNYITTHPLIFDQPTREKVQLHAFTGPSLLYAHGDDWRRMRKIMVPCFGPPQVDSLIPIFISKGQEAARKLGETVGIRGKVVNASQLWAQLTIDIIGLAGFDHAFNALSSDQDELLRAWMGTIGRKPAEKRWFTDLQLIETWWAHILFVGAQY